MGIPRQKSLILILAREFATNLAVPMFVADDEGRLVFYNEPAEELLGRTLLETGEMPLEEWRQLLSPQTLDGRPLPDDESPIRVAFDEHRPFHNRLRITSVAGETYEISSTAFPLFGRGREFMGIVTLFWERD
jgi:PAS domain-containing protein